MEKLNCDALRKIDEIVAKHKDQAGPCIEMLHEVQNELGYVPFEAMEKIAEATGSSPAEVYGVVMFYAQFTTEPKGKHVINVCLGTACYVKGAQKLIDRVEKLTWRAIGRIVGCGVPEGYTCVMKPLGSMSELDAMPNKFIHPATFFKARSYFDMCGVTPARKGTYESACQQGWAPAPTNEAQKAIWDKVHAIPDQPLKIKYEKPDQSPNTGK